MKAKNKPVKTQYVYFYIQQSFEMERNENKIEKTVIFVIFFQFFDSEC